MHTRVEHLEKQNRALKFAALLLLVLVVGVAAVQKPGGGESLTVQTLTLVDASGNVRAVLTTDKNGPMLRFETADGARLRVGLVNSEPHVDVWDNAAGKWRNKVGGPTVMPVR